MLSDDYNSQLLSSGYQCQTCTQVIHKKCLPSVVTICAGETRHPTETGSLSEPDPISPLPGLRLEVPHTWKSKTYKVI